MIGNTKAVPGFFENFFNKSRLIYGGSDSDVYKKTVEFIDFFEKLDKIEKSICFVCNHFFRAFHIKANMN